MPFCDDLEGWNEGDRREAQEGGDLCIHKLPHHLKQLYSKKKKKKRHTLGGSKLPGLRNFRVYTEFQSVSKPRPLR